jgi:nitrate/nitrite transporter NarK
MHGFAEAISETLLNENHKPSLARVSIPKDKKSLIDCWSSLSELRNYKLGPIFDWPFRFLSELFVAGYLIVGIRQTSQNSVEWKITLYLLTLAMIFLLIVTVFQTKGMFEKKKKSNKEAKQTEDEVRRKKAWENLNWYRKN